MHATAPRHVAALLASTSNAQPPLRTAHHHPALQRLAVRTLYVLTITLLAVVAPFVMSGVLRGCLLSFRATVPAEAGSSCVCGWVGAASLLSKPALWFVDVLPSPDALCHPPPVHTVIGLVGSVGWYPLTIAFPFLCWIKVRAGWARRAWCPAVHPPALQRRQDMHSGLAHLARYFPRCRCTAPQGCGWRPSELWA